MPAVQTSARERLVLLALLPAAALLYGRDLGVPSLEFDEGVYLSSAGDRRERPALHRRARRPGLRGDRGRARPRPRAPAPPRGAGLAARPRRPRRTPGRRRAALRDPAPAAPPPPRRGRLAARAPRRVDAPAATEPPHVGSSRRGDGARAPARSARPLDGARRGARAARRGRAARAHPHPGRGGQRPAAGGSCSRGAPPRWRPSTRPTCVEQRLPRRRHDPAGRGRRGCRGGRALLPRVPGSPAALARRFPVRTEIGRVEVYVRR